ncbi:hypothetical protein ACLMJK_007868 [Lecanora helva]
MLRVGILLLCTYTTFAAVISSPVNLAKRQGIQNPSPICVDPTQHPQWTAPAQGQINPYYCATAIFGLQIRYGKIKQDEYTFYSEAGIKGVAPEGTIGLPQGSASRLEGTGNCAAVVRMRHDYFPTALPYPDGRYLNPKSLGKQNARWGEILLALNVVQSKCVSQNKMGGWILIGEGIVASLWPAGSGVDENYGYNATETDGNRFLTETGKNSTAIWGPQR